eukprot:1160679-Pelagomonas_calceolata.AAC.1
MAAKSAHRDYVPAGMYNSNPRVPCGACTVWHRVLCWCWTGGLRCMGAACWRSCSAPLQKQCCVRSCAEGPVLVLDWRSEVHGDGLLAQLCHPLPDSLTEGQHQQQQRAGGSDADSRAGCSLACVLDALQEEQQVSFRFQGRTKEQEGVMLAAKLAARGAIGKLGGGGAEGGPGLHSQCAVTHSL